MKFCCTSKFHIIVSQKFHIYLQVLISFTTHDNFSVFSRCASQWQEYHTERQQVIDLMNESEKKLAEFSVAKAISSFEAEEKLISHKVKLLKTQAVHNLPS